MESIRPPRAGRAGAGPDIPIPTSQISHSATGVVMSSGVAGLGGEALLQSFEKSLRLLGSRYASLRIVPKHLLYKYYFHWCSCFKDKNTRATYFRGLKHLGEDSLGNHVTLRVKYPNTGPGGGGGRALLPVNKNGKFPPEEEGKLKKNKPNSPYRANGD